jgi:hypothetical protein
LSISDFPLKGSLEELYNSEVGANLIVEGNIGFMPAIDGNGFFSTGHWYLGNRIIIPENGLQLILVFFIQ